MKLCECGCGKPAPIAKQNRRERKQIKGEPIRFIHGHNRRGLIGDKSPHWKGGRSIDEQGYVRITKPNGYIREHILIAEKVFGKPLPPKAKVHHHDGNPQNNVNSNLVICEDQAYHMLLHKRKNALEACGNAIFYKCWICKEYDDPKNMYIYPNRPNIAQHSACLAKYQKPI